MDFKSFQAEIGRCASELQTLAATGALLRLRMSSDHLDMQAREALEGFVNLALPHTIDQLDAEQAEIALGYIDLLIEDAVELLRNPARAPGWTVDEPHLLNAQGRLSRYGFRAIEALTADIPDLSRALQGSFLDVGTGTGGIALEAVARCPKLRAVAIDIWEPGLRIAEAKAAASPHRDRIEIRKADLRALSEAEAYDVAWLPAPFMDRPTINVGLERLFQALKPNGYLIVGYQTLPSNPVTAAYAKLRIIRSGGAIWNPADLEREVRDRGFLDVRTKSPFPEANYIVGRKPS